MVKPRAIPVAIRVDAGPHIGTGHLMRTLTLADALRQQGAKIRFVGRELPLHLRQLLEGKGHEFVALPAAPVMRAADDLAHSHWLGVGQGQDAEETVAALADLPWAWLVVDHYALDARWEGALRAGAGRILAIDDLADRPHDCDILLDQNFYPDMERRYLGKVPSSAALLIGPRYALLRDEFSRLHADQNHRDGHIRRVLVLLGGVDASNHTRKVIHGLAQLPAPVPAVDVVIGLGHPARKEIEALCSRHGFQCHVQTAEVARLMHAADLAIGAGGSTSWERCCVGLPTVCLTQAVNQVPIARGLEAAGAILYQGEGGDVTAENIRDTVQSLITQPARVLSLSRSAHQLVDGQGAQRVCEQMLNRT